MEQPFYGRTGALDGAHQGLSVTRRHLDSSKHVKWFPSLLTVPQRILHMVTEEDGVDCSILYFLRVACVYEDLKKRLPVRERHGALLGDVLKWHRALLDQGRGGWGVDSANAGVFHPYIPAYNVCVIRDGQPVATHTEVSRRAVTLLGKDHDINDIPLDHPSCSAQHAALEVRFVYSGAEELDRRMTAWVQDRKAFDWGVTDDIHAFCARASDVMRELGDNEESWQMELQVLDLGSTNGTRLNGPPKARMPFWNYFINTRPEVDDDDLPLSKHRVYDDDGNVRSEKTTTTTPPPNSRVSAVIAKAKASVKNSTTMSPKTRANILRSVGVTPTAPRRTSKTDADADAGADATAAPKSPPPSKPRVASASRSPARLPSGAESPTPTSQKPTPTKAKKSASPKKATPKRSASKRSKRSVTPKKKKSRSRAEGTAAEKSPRKGSPKRSVSPARRGASRSPASRNGASPKKSLPKSGASTPRRGQSEGRPATKRTRSPSTQEDGNPSLRWTVSVLRAYAAENKIDVSQEKTKAEILAKIEGQVKR